MKSHIEKLFAFKEFQDLSDTSYETIEKYARIYNAPAHTNILFEKKDCEYVYYILTGVVSLYRLNEKGRRKVIFMFPKGHYINEDQQGDYHSAICAQAFEDSTLLCIPKDIFLQLMVSDPVFMKHVYASLSGKIRRMYRQLKNGEARLDKKLASKFYKLAKDHGIPSEKGVLINMELSVTYLSDLLGAQRESVSRALKTLVDAELIHYEKKSFYVRDTKKLADYFKK